MVSAIAIVTHPQVVYDPRESIGKAVEQLFGLSGLEIMVLRNDVAPESAEIVVGPYQKFPKPGIDSPLMLESRDIIYSFDGQLKPEKAQDIVESYGVISIFGGCLDTCHYRTYKSLIDAFKNSPKKELTMRFFLDGIFNDYFPSISMTFNLNEILDFNGNVEQGEPRDKDILSMFESNTFYPRFLGMNCSLTYNGRLLYRNNQGHNKTLNIEIFDTVTK